MHLDIPEKFLTKHHIRGEVLRARANWFNFERPYFHVNQIQYFKGPPFQGEPSAQLKIPWVLDRKVQNHQTKNARTMEAAQH